MAWLCALYRISRRDPSVSWTSYWQRIRLLHRWQRAFEREEKTLPMGNGPFTAILLSYARPENIDLLVRILLRVPSVGRVVLCNNNPAISLRRWISVTDDRLCTMENNQRGSAGMRYRIAFGEQAPSFLCIDDDIFLTPAQIEALCQACVADPSVPHSTWGQLLRGDGSVLRSVQNEDGEVDIINRVYAFHAKHLREFRRLLRILWPVDEPRLWTEWSHWDDVLLSFTGNARPVTHNFGKEMNCPTASQEGIAVWRQRDFERLRGELFLRLNAIKPLPSLKGAEHREHVPA